MKNKELGSIGALVMGGALLAAPGRRAELDHVGAYNFKVEISGVAAGYFKGVDGLSSEIEVIEYRDGRGDDLLLRKRPGRTKFGDITLKKGYIVTEHLATWWQNTREGRLDPREITISVVDSQGETLRSYSAFGAWPKQWSVNGFDGKGNDVVTEEITFVVEDIDLL